MLPDRSRVHVFLSPHPEDVLMACGGTLAYLSARGARVLVLALFARVPMSGEDNGNHERTFVWPPRDPDLWARVVAESHAAYRALGVEVHYGQYLPAPFRRHPLEGRRLYPAPWSYHRAPDASEGDVPLRIAGEVSTLSSSGARVYLPLALGRHVDHVLTRRSDQALKQQGYEVFYYEEFPEVLNSRQARHLVERGWRPWMVPLSSHDLSIKVKALQAYKTLVPLFFGNLYEMRRRIQDYMYTVSGLGYPAERFWSR